MGRHEMRWEELRWDELRLSASVKCGVWGVKSAMWSVRKVFAWRCIAPGSCAGHLLGQQHCNSFAQSTRARAWLPHSACKFLSSSAGKWFMKALMTYEKRWAGIRWEELRWDEVWSVKSAMWSVGREECSVQCGVWSEESSEKWEVWSVDCEVWSVECEVELQMWHVKQDTSFAECTHARAWLAHGACKFYRWERSYIYIYMATSAPPRALVYSIIIEGNLEVKLPTIWTDEKQSRAEGERRERLEERRSEKRKSQKKEDADARKGRKVAKHCVFPMICGSGGSKSRLAKAAGAEPAGQMRDEKLHAVVARSTFPSQNVQNTFSFGPLLEVEMSKKCTPLWREAHFQVKMSKHTRFGPLLEVEMSKKCTPLWREAHFQVKMSKTPQLRTTFGSWDVEKVHAVVARSTFPSQNVQNTSASDHFWKLRCRKSARRCGAKHISKSKCTKHTRSGPLLEVKMSKKCTPLWREAHSEVKSVKNWRSPTTFGS